MTSGLINTNELQRLNISNSVKNDLEKFVSAIIDSYGHNLIGIWLFGSSVSGDYIESQSDMNLLIVYSELDIDDLEKISGLAQKWFKKRRFAPRFLSKRNLLESAKFFQIDWMEIRDASMLLYGQNILDELPVSFIDMKWQLSHEIKRMRMRIKQQFWKSIHDTKLMNSVLIQRITSIVHLMRVYLFLKTKVTPPTSNREIIDMCSKHIHIEKQFIETILAAKNSGKLIDKESMPDYFTRLLNHIRLIDQATDNLKAS